MRFSPGCGCCGIVLLWDVNCNAAVVGLTEAKTVYTDAGIVAHLSTEWTENIHDYSAIVWLMAESDPPWWASIADGSWVGRLHVSAEYTLPGGNWDATRNYVNSKNALHGMTVAANISSSSACNTETATGAIAPLTEDQPFLKHAASASVSGGTTLYTTHFNGIGQALPIIQRKMQAGGAQIDWVICGDSNHASDFCTGAADLNKHFLRNLWRVPLP